MAVMAREAWTDERLDDLKDHMDEGFREVKMEIKATRAELKGEIRDLREKMDAKFDRLTYTLIAGLVGLLATHYLG
ncbi:MAG TPA: hypothetical protein VFS64_01875 [Solirubrobacterales bacterium]|nr:hypothetical protein [Solirubrobacterales bacterium]